jgi:hypothetical protein
MNVKTEHIIIVALIVVLAGSYFGYINLQKGTLSTQPVGTTPVPYTPGPSVPTTPTGTTNPDAVLYLEVADAVLGTDVSTGTTTVDVCKSTSGVFNFALAYDTKTQAANPQAMNTLYKDGSEIILHVDCTGNPTHGTSYYDGWYYTIVHQGNPIYQLQYNDFVQVAGSPAFTYSISQSALATNPITGYVSWTTGIYNTPFWNLGKIYIFPRTTNSLTETVSYQFAKLAAVSDAATWVNGTTMPTANGTLASTSESLTFSMQLNYANIGYGWPILYVTGAGQIINYQPTIIFTTSMLAIGSGPLTSAGWSPLQDTTLYAEKGFYKLLTPQFTGKNSVLTFSIPIPIDASNAAKATKYKFSFWILDCENPNAVALGTTSTSAPTAYGFITAYGPQSIIEPMGYTSSSGAGATPQLEAYITTAS